MYVFSGGQIQSSFVSSRTWRDERRLNLSPDFLKKLNMVCVCVVMLAKVTKKKEKNTKKIKNKSERKITKEKRTKSEECSPPSESVSSARPHWFLSKSHLINIMYDIVLYLDHVIQYNMMSFPNPIEQYI